MTWSRPGRLLAAIAASLAIQLEAAGPPPETAADFRPLLVRQAGRYAKLTAQDCYKFLYQACLGAEHAVPDEESARQRLGEEMARLPAGPEEPLVEPITPDGSLVRVHLRTFVVRHGDAAALARAFFLTGRRKSRTTAELAAAWRQVSALAASGQLPFSAAEAETFGRRMEAESYPAVRHSEAFRREYGPAYRVIAREFLAGALPPAQ